MTRKKKIITAQDLMSENQIQMACIRFLCQWCPWVMFNHSPNEGKRTVGQKVHLARMGMHSGWPDLEILSNGRPYFIEFKKKNGRFSQKQLEFSDWCLVNGFKYAICHSTKEFEDILCEWGFIRKDAFGVVHLIKNGGALLNVPADSGEENGMD